MAWATLAAAAIPSVMSLGKDLFGGDSEMEKRRRALSQQLYDNSQKGALEQPGVQAAMAQLREVLDRKRRADEAKNVRLGRQGTESAIAQGAQRSRTQAHGMLDLVAQGQRQKRSSLQAALGSATQQQRLRQQRQGQVMGVLGQATAAGAQAFADSPYDNQGDKKDDQGGRKKK